MKSAATKKVRSDDVYLTPKMMLRPMSEEHKAAWRGAVAKAKGRPKSDNPKEQVTLRLDAEVLEHFREGGAGWQTRINSALRKIARVT
jgi:uncharacterized protein (DUF4415 family)